MDPPEHPLPIVYLIGPYASTMCSLSISTASACTTMLQFCPLLSRVGAATIIPRESAVSSVTLGGVLVPWLTPHEAPPGISSLPSHCGCGAHGCQLPPGVKSTATWYSSRSSYPVSTRMMYGTVRPLSVVVLATSCDGGGLLGS